MTAAGGGVELFRNFAALAGGQVAAKVIGFGAFAVLARRLGSEGYGAIEYVVGVTLFFATLADCGLGPVGVRRLARSPEHLAALAAQIPMARLGLSLLCVPLMVLVAAPALPAPAAHGLVWLFAASLLAVPWRQDWLLQATARLRAAAFAQVLQVTVFALAVLLLVRQPTDITRVGWAELAAVAAASLYYLGVQGAKITPFRLRATVDGLSGLVKEGALVGLASFIWAANQSAPLLLVASFVGGDDTAWFAAAARLTGSLLTFSNLYYFTLYPAIARTTVTDRDELARILGASFRVVAWGGTLLALALTVLAEPLVLLLFGSKFGPAASILMIMAWTLPITLLSGHARWSLVAAGIQSRVVYAQAAGSAALTILGIPLVVSWGGRGGAVAAVAASVAVWLASHAFAARRGARLPASAIALTPGLLAVGIIGATRLLGLDPWLAGLGVGVFAAAAPLVDRRLLPDLARLCAVRLVNATVPEPVA